MFLLIGMPKYCLSKVLINLPCYTESGLKAFEWLSLITSDFAMELKIKRVKICRVNEEKCMQKII